MRFFFGHAVIEKLIVTYTCKNQLATGRAGFDFIKVRLHAGFLSPRLHICVILWLSVHLIIFAIEYDGCRRAGVQPERRAVSSGFGKSAIRGACTCTSIIYIGAYKHIKLIFIFNLLFRALEFRGHRQSNAPPLRYVVCMKIAKTALRITTGLSVVELAAFRRIRFQSYIADWLM